MNPSESFDQPTADQTATTNTPLDTFVPVGHTTADGYLLYSAADNAFIALYPDEFFHVRQEGEDNNKAIHELQEANQTVTEKSLALAELLRNPLPVKDDLKNAQNELDQALATLGVKSEAAKTRIEKITNLTTDQKKLIELTPLTLRRDSRHRTYYVPAERLKQAAADKRIYLVEGKAEREKGPKEKLFNGAKFNGAEVKRRIAEEVVDKAKFEKKWRLKPSDGDEYAGQFFSDWAKSMGAPAKDFLEREQKSIIQGVFGPVNSDPSDPHRKIDLKSEAQLMRWAVGAGLEANVQGFQGNLYDKRDKDWKSRFKRAGKAVQFNIKANAEASFALGEAKAHTIVYLPHYAGWHLTPAAAGIALDLGQFRFRGEMSLYAVAGASIALEAGAGLKLTASKQGLKGVPLQSKAVKANLSAEGKVELFVGLKEGIDLSGALQWLNPEGFIDEKSPKRKDPTKTWGEYVDVATATAGVAGIEGLAASLGFEVGFEGGSFMIAAKADLCLGLGGSGNFSCKVGAASIGQFFMCVAHQLKQADYDRLEKLMKLRVFKAFNQVLYLVQTGSHKFRDFVNSEIFDTVDRIGDAYLDALEAVRNEGEHFIRKLEHQMRDKWGWFAYMPPEARGALICSVMNIANLPQYASNRELRQLAAFAVNELLATAQSERHLENTLDRLTVAIGDEGDRAASVLAVNWLLKDSGFADGLVRAETRVAKASEPLIQRPFMRNDDMTFIVAEMGFSHASAVA